MGRIQAREVFRAIRVFGVVAADTKSGGYLIIGRDTTMEWFNIN